MDISDDESSDIQEMTEMEVEEFKEQQLQESMVKRKNSKKGKPKAKREKGKSKEKGTKEEQQQKKQEKQKKKRQKAQTYIHQPPTGNSINDCDLIRYGNARFPKLSKRNQFTTLTKKARETLRVGVTWWITKGEYNQHFWGAIFESMYQTQVRDLRLFNNENPRIVREICLVRFEALEILYLYENKIVSIQLLSKMKFPHLKDLSLRDNLITNIRCMSRMTLDNLEQLSLTDNPILQMSKLYYLNTNSLLELFLEWKSSPVMAEDISWMAKLKKNHSKLTTLEKILIQSKKRISQIKFDEMLARKYRKNVSALVKRKMT